MVRCFCSLCVRGGPIWCFCSVRNGGFARRVRGGPIWCFCSPCVRRSDIAGVFVIFIPCVIELVR